MVGSRFVEHMAQSNREIILACMIEDLEAVERIDEIAAVEGVDLLAVGPSDLSRSLGVSGQPDHPRLVAAIDRVREAVKKGAGARLALPLNHAAFPRNAAQLKELGAGYTNCAPTPEARLLQSLRAQAAEARKLLARLGRFPRQADRAGSHDPPGEARRGTGEHAIGCQADHLKDHGHAVRGRGAAAERIGAPGSRRAGKLISGRRPLECHSRRNGGELVILGFDDPAAATCSRFQNPMRSRSRQSVRFL